MTKPLSWFRFRMSMFIRSWVFRRLLLIFHVWMLMAVLCFSAEAATDLRCDYRTNPLGIDSLEPQLSWKLDVGSSNVEQHAYHVLVASSLEKLAADEGDLWDSRRRVSSDASCVYSGRDLSSGKSCFWKVKVYTDSTNAMAWSSPAFWSMGLLESEDWKALWIGFDQGRRNVKESEDLFLPPIRYLRKEFKIKQPVKRAMLYATALGLYEMRLNGERVGDDYFTPGWTDYHQRIYYNTYDVTAMLDEGENVVGALLADGWFSGYSGLNKQRDRYGEETRLRAQLVVEYEDGRTDVFGTDESWRASTGPTLEADLFMGETYDARLGMPGWDRVGFDAAAWAAVSDTSRIRTPVQAYPSVTVKAFQELTPRSVSEPEASVFIFDMGRNFAGFARLKVEAEAGTELVLRFGERLHSDGTLFTTNLNGARATDTYICKGDGVEVWEPRFTYHGFQYVELTGYPGTPGSEVVTGIELTSSTPVTGRFECSNPMLNQLYKNIAQTQRANFMDIPTDCPQRDERLGWTGDAQAYIRAACFNSDVQSFFRKWLVDLEDAQRPNGDFPRFAPSLSGAGSGGAAWADAGVICPWALYEFYGDQALLERQYESMKRFIEFREKNYKYHGFGDWLHLGEPTSKKLISIAYTAGSAKILSEIATVLKEKSDARQYEKIYESFRKTFNREFVDKKGRIEGDTQTAYVLALGFDLLDEKERVLAEEGLIEKIEEANGHLTTGFVGTRDLMNVFSKIGRTDVAYRLLLNDTFPSWLFSVKHGATSIWEHWDGWTPEDGLLDVRDNSFSHYTYGSVGQWMFENIGGIKSAEAGFKEIVIQPVMTEHLTLANVSYDSIHGRIAVEWKRDGTNVALNVEIPPNTTATIHVPGQRKTESVGSGSYTFEGTYTAH